MRREKGLGKKRKRWGKGEKKRRKREKSLPRLGEDPRPLLPPSRSVLAPPRHCSAGPWKKRVKKCKKPPITSPFFLTLLSKLPKKVDFFFPTPLLPRDPGLGLPPSGALPGPPHLANDFSSQIPF